MIWQEEKVMAADQERFKFVDFEFERFPNGLCRATVGLQKRGGDPYTGTFEGSGSATGALRCAAQASLAALAQAVGAEYSFELLGVKTVSAFDQTIVIVALSVRGERNARQLVGSYVSHSDSERAAAIAVLSATNRFLASTAAHPTSIEVDP
jgi:hypothetical protein